MKKTSILLLICLFCFLLTACDPTWYKYDNEFLNSEVVKVELIDYQQPKSKKVNTFFPIRKLLLDFDLVDLEKMTIIETLDDENLEGFFRELSEIGLWSHWIHLNSPDGICIRLIYNNGDFDVLSVKTINGNAYSIVMKYDENGNVLDFIGPMTDTDDLQEIINKYFYKT